MGSRLSLRAEPSSAVGDETLPPVTAERPRLRTLVFRGLMKTCPRCGGGPLFERWTRVRDRCPACDLQYLEDRGDPWAFLVLIDRGAFIFPIVVALYFGLHRTSFPLFLAFALGLGALFIYTTPNRYGVSIGLVYWARLKFGGAREVG